jgi:predicted nucleic acid-binding Zn ribbon protein
MARQNRIEWIRRAVLREWRGGDDPVPDNAVENSRRFIQAVLKSAGAADGMDEERLREAWRDIAGDLVARHANPDSLKKGCLTLKVLQPAMRFQLEQMKPRLLANLKQELGEGVVTSVRFTLG